LRWQSAGVSSVGLSVGDYLSPGKKKPPGHKAQEVLVSTGWVLT
jgi:hypothetical protein